MQKVPGTDDGRLVAISLTDEGTDALADILPAAQAIEAKLRAAAVGPDELKAFCNVMERMHAVLDDDPEAKPRSRMDLEGLDM